MDEFVRLREAALSFDKIARLYKVSYWMVYEYGKRVLPAELVKAKAVRGRHYKPEEVLPAERLIKWRRAGKSFRWIAGRTGLSRFVVERYAEKVLPTELRHKSTRWAKQTAERKRRRSRCRRCTFYEWEGNPVRDGLCLWCRVEMAGGDLWTLHYTDGWAILLAEEASGG